MFGSKKLVSAASQPGELPVERKFELVLAGVRGERSVSELCREAGVSTDHYHRWQHQFLTAAHHGLAYPGTDWRRLEEQVRKLEEENRRLLFQIQVLRELCMEHD